MGGAELLDLFRSHGERFAVAYPDVRVIPKEHWGFLFARQISRGGFALDCFVGERQMNLLKNCAKEVSNTSRFEVTILQRMLAHTLVALNDGDLFQDHLVGDVTEMDGLFGDPAATTVAAMSFRSTRIQRGDLLLVNDAAIKVEGCAKIDGGFHLIFEQLEFVEQVTSSASRWKAHGQIRAQALSRDTDFRFAAAFSWSSDVVLVLAF